MGSKLIVALDYADQASALALLDALNPDECRIKIGKHMFTRFGPDWVRTCQARGFDVFLDLKFHDIPNTVADACTAAAELGVWMVNVHASGGLKMLQAARTAIDGADHQPLLIAVTVLTSLSADDCLAMGIEDLSAHALQLARLSYQAGCDGVVCSAHEVRVMKQAISESLLCVTPGIRFAEHDDDQTRVMTPAMAVAKGADYLVVGRPITQASAPAEVIKKMRDSILY